jgi:P27 family predicted phage terminase small subunit
VEAEKMVAKTGEVLVAKGSGNFYQNPYFHVANKAWDQLRAMLGQFGLSPAERSRVRALAVNENEPSLAEVLFQGLDIDD